MRKEKPPEDVALFSKLNRDQYLKFQVPRIVGLELVDLQTLKYYACHLNNLNAAKLLHKEVPNLKDMKT